LERGIAQEVVNLFDRRDREAMIKIADVHRIGVPPAENPDYVAAVREMRGDWIAALQDEVTAMIARRNRDTRAE
jgi:hypothetical protein